MTSSIKISLMFEIWLSGWYAKTWWRLRVKSVVFGLWIFVSAVTLHMFRATAHTLPEPNRDPLWIWYFYCFIFFDFQNFPDCWGVFCRIHVASRLPLHHRSGEPPNRALSFYERNLRIELWKAFFMIWEGWLKKQQKILRCDWRDKLTSYWFGGWDVKHNPIFWTHEIGHQFLIWCGTCPFFCQIDEIDSKKKLLV